MSLEGPCGGVMASSALSPLLDPFESPQDEGRQPGKIKGKAGKSGIHTQPQHKGKGTLPPSNRCDRCSSQRPKRPPGLWVSLHGAPFISDSPGSPIQTRLPSPPLEFQPREHEQQMMSLALGSQAFRDKMVSVVGCQLFTFSLSLLNNHTYILTSALFSGKLKSLLERATQILTRGGSSCPRSVLTCYEIPAKTSNILGNTEGVLPRMAAFTKRKLPAKPCIYRGPQPHLRAPLRAQHQHPAATTIPTSMHINYYFSNRVSELRFLVPWPADKNNHNLSSPLHMIQDNELWAFCRKKDCIESSGH